MLELRHKKIIRTCVAVMIAAVFILNILTYVVSVVRYHGDGMEPTLQGGQILLINKVSDVSEGDVIAFYYNNKVLVRRLICEGGKTILMDDHGKVKIDGEELDEPYVESLSKGQCDIIFPYTVLKNHVFVMGDQRTIAMDSRLEAIGTIPKNNIIGKVILAW